MHTACNACAYLHPRFTRPTPKSARIITTGSIRAVRSICRRMTFCQWQQSGRLSRRSQLAWLHAQSAIASTQLRNQLIASAKLLNSVTWLKCLSSFERSLGDVSAWPTDAISPGAPLVKQARSMICAGPTRKSDSKGTGHKNTHTHQVPGVSQSCAPGFVKLVKPIERCGHVQPAMLLQRLRRGNGPTHAAFPSIWANSNERQTADGETNSRRLYHEAALRQASGTCEVLGAVLVLSVRDGLQFPRGAHGVGCWRVRISGVPQCGRNSSVMRAPGVDFRAHTLWHPCLADSVQVCDLSAGHGGVMRRVAKASFLFPHPLRSWAYPGGFACFIPHS